MGKPYWGHFLHDILVDKGVPENWAIYLNIFILLVLGIVLVLLVDFAIWKILRKFSAAMAKRTKTNFDNFAVTNRLPRFLARIFPLLLALELAPVVFYDFQYAENIAFKVLNILGVLLALRIARSFFQTVRDYLKTLPRFMKSITKSMFKVK